MPVNNHTPLGRDSVHSSTSLPQSSVPREFYTVVVLGHQYTVTSLDIVQKTAKVQPASAEECMIFRDALRREHALPPGTVHDSAAVAGVVGMYLRNGGDDISVLRIATVLESPFATADTETSVVAPQLPRPDQVVPQGHWPTLPDLAPGISSGTPSITVVGGGAPPPPRRPARTTGTPADHMGTPAMMAAIFEAANSAKRTNVFTPPAGATARDLRTFVDAFLSTGRSLPRVSSERTGYVLDLIMACANQMDAVEAQIGRGQGRSILPAPQPQQPQQPPAFVQPQPQPPQQPPAFVQPQPPQPPAFVQPQPQPPQQPPAFVQPQPQPPQQPPAFVQPQPPQPQQPPPLDPRFLPVITDAVWSALGQDDHQFSWPADVTVNDLQAYLAAADESEASDNRLFEEFPGVDRRDFNNVMTQMANMAAAQSELPASSFLPSITQALISALAQPELDFVPPPGVDAEQIRAYIRRADTSPHTQELMALLPRGTNPSDVDKVLDKMFNSTSLDEAFSRAMLNITEGVFQAVTTRNFQVRGITNQHLSFFIESVDHDPSHIILPQGMQWQDLAPVLGAIRSYLNTSPPIDAQPPTLAIGAPIPADPAIVTPAEPAGRGIQDYHRLITELHTSAAEVLGDVDHPPLRDAMYSTLVEELINVTLAQTVPQMVALGATRVQTAQFVPEVLANLDELTNILAENQRTQRDLLVSLYAMINSPELRGPDRQNNRYLIAQIRSRADGLLADISPPPPALTNEVIDRLNAIALTVIEDSNPPEHLAHATLADVAQFALVALNSLDTVMASVRDLGRTQRDALRAIGALLDRAVVMFQPQPSPAPAPPVPTELEIANNNLLIQELSSRADRILAGRVIPLNEATRDRLNAEVWNAMVSQTSPVLENVNRDEVAQFIQQALVPSELREMTAQARVAGKSAQDLLTTLVALIEASDFAHQYPVRPSGTPPSNNDLAQSLFNRTDHILAGRVIPLNEATRDYLDTTAWNFMVLPSPPGLESVTHEQVAQFVQDALAPHHFGNMVEAAQNNGQSERDVLRALSAMLNASENLVQGAPVRPGRPQPLTPVSDQEHGRRAGVVTIQELRERTHRVLGSETHPLLHADMLKNLNIAAFRAMSTPGAAVDLGRAGSVEVAQYVNHILDNLASVTAAGTSQQDVLDTLSLMMDSAAGLQSRTEPQPQDSRRHRGSPPPPPPSGGAAARSSSERQILLLRDNIEQILGTKRFPLSQTTHDQISQALMLAINEPHRLRLPGGTHEEVALFVAHVFEDLHAFAASLNRTEEDVLLGLSRLMDRSAAIEGEQSNRELIRVLSERADSIVSDSPPPPLPDSIRERLYFEATRRTAPRLDDANRVAVAQFVQEMLSSSRLTQAVTDSRRFGRNQRDFLSALLAMMDSPELSHPTQDRIHLALVGDLGHETDRQTKAAKKAAKVLGVPQATTKSIRSCTTAVLDAVESGLFVPPDSTTNNDLLSFVQNVERFPGIIAPRPGMTWADVDRVMSAINNHLDKLQTQKEETFSALAPSLSIPKPPVIPPERWTIPSGGSTPLVMEIISQAIFDAARTEIFLMPEHIQSEQINDFLKKISRQPDRFPLPLNVSYGGVERVLKVLRNHMKSQPPVDLQMDLPIPKSKPISARVKRVVYGKEGYERRQRAKEQGKAEAASTSPGVAEAAMPRRRRLPEPSSWTAGTNIRVLSLAVLDAATSGIFQSPTGTVNNHLLQYLDAVKQSPDKFTLRPGVSQGQVNGVLRALKKYLDGLSPAPRADTREGENPAQSDIPIKAHGGFKMLKLFGKGKGKETSAGAQMGGGGLAPPRARQPSVDPSRGPRQSVGQYLYPEERPGPQEPGPQERGPEPEASEVIYAVVKPRSQRPRGPGRGPGPGLDIDEIIGNDRIPMPRSRPGPVDRSEESEEEAPPPIPGTAPVDQVDAGAGRRGPRRAPPPVPRRGPGGPGPGPDSDV